MRVSSIADSLPSDGWRAGDGRARSARKADRRGRMVQDFAEALMGTEEDALCAERTGSARRSRYMSAESIAKALAEAAIDEPEEVMAIAEAA